MKKRYMLCMTAIFAASAFLLKAVDIFTPTISLVENYIPREEFSIFVTVEQQKVKYNTEWWQRIRPQGDDYYLTIPNGAENSPKTVNFTVFDEIQIDGKSYKSGDKIKLDDKANYTVSAGDKEYTLGVFYTSDITTAHIITEDGIYIGEDIDERKSGYLVMVNSNGIAYEGELEYIKGRGNQSWLYDKKSFGIKLAEESPLLGMNKAKKWALIASYPDKTLMKNILGFNLADNIGLNFTSECKPLDLYINGVYRGNYLLVEKVEIGNGRVDITNLDKQNEKINEGVDLATLALGGVDNGNAEGTEKWVCIPENPENITGGYLLEIQFASRYFKTAGGFVSNNGQAVSIRGPELPSQKQAEYISDYYNKYEEAILSPDGINSEGKHYSEYIDVESFAKMYIMQEYLKNIDGAITSLYMYKDAGGKLTAGPIWDLDMCLGEVIERDGMKFQDPLGIWIYNSKQYEGKHRNSPTMFAVLCSHDDFMEIVAEIWRQQFVGTSRDMMLNIDALNEKMSRSAIVDKFRYRKDVKFNNFAEVEVWYAQQLDELKNFIVTREAFLSGFFAEWQ